MNNVSLKKVIFLVPRYIFDSVSFITYQYVSALRQEGLKVNICSLRKPALPSGSIPCKSRWNLLSCQILVTHLFLPDLVGFVLSRFFPSVKWVPFLHCDVLGGLVAEKKPFAKLKLQLWRAILSRAEEVISPSAYALRSLKNIKRTVIIPHCIVIDMEHAFRSEAGVGLGNQTIKPLPNWYGNSASYVFIGRDTRAKRLSCLIRLVANDPKLTLKIVGELDHSKKMLSQLTRSALTRIAIIGKQSNPYDYVTAGDIVVCPSGREGFGLVPIECIARGIPVAVINEGVFRELYGGTSITYEKIADLPYITDRLTTDLVNIGRRFVGREALSDRTKKLLTVLR